MIIVFVCVLIFTCDFLIDRHVRNVEQSCGNIKFMPPVANTQPEFAVFRSLGSWPTNKHLLCAHDGGGSDAELCFQSCYLRESLDLLIFCLAKTTFFE